MKNQSTNKKFWWFYHLGLVLFSAAAAMLMKQSQLGNPFDPTVIVPFTVILLTSVFTGYLAIYLERRITKYDSVKLSRKILPALLLFYVSAFLVANSAITISVFGWFLYKGRDMSEFIPQLINQELTFSKPSFFLWLAIFTIVLFYFLWQKSAKKEMALAEENLKYRYNTLKAQVNPHFLFNSLNTLSEIVYTDAKRADQYIQQLAAIYRYILDNENKDFIALSEEITFVRQYFKLQQERDNGKIALQIDLPNADSYKIIPVSLQLLVENALKHNTMSEKNPLSIHIYEEGNHVVVANPLQRKNIPGYSTKTGLSNLQERVRLMMQRELIVREENDRFLVKLPVIPL